MADPGAVAVSYGVTVVTLVAYAFALHRRSRRAPVRRPPRSR
jgi:hypothetical protein